MACDKAKAGREAGVVRLAPRFCGCGVVRWPGLALSRVFINSVIEVEA
jgi:hypothetical protein